MTTADSFRIWPLRRHLLLGVGLLVVLVGVAISAVAFALLRAEAIREAGQKSERSAEQVAASLDDLLAPSALAVRLLALEPALTSQEESAWEARVPERVQALELAPLSINVHLADASGRYVGLRRTPRRPIAPISMRRRAPPISCKCSRGRESSAGTSTTADCKRSEASLPPWRAASTRGKRRGTEGPWTPPPSSAPHLTDSA